MYEILEAVLWSTVAIPLLGFVYCLFLESHSYASPSKTSVQRGSTAGLVAVAAHLAQMIGLNLSVSTTRPALLGGLWVGAPLIGICFSAISMGTIRQSSDPEIRRVGLWSAAIAGASMALLVVLFFMGFGTVG